MEDFYADQYIYKVGELAKISGVNAQTVRRYDEKGILSSKRDPQSGYRYYNASDIGMMINARNYRKHGVSLDKAAELLSSDSNQNLKILYEQKKTQENEIKMQQLKLQLLDEQINAIHKSDYFLANCEIGVRPAMYVCWCREFMTVMKEKRRMKVFSYFIDKQPFSNTCSKFSIKHLQKKEINAYTGMMIEEKYESLFNIKKNQFVEYIPSARCLYTMCITAGDLDSIYRKVVNPHCKGLHHALDYMQKEGLKVNGDIVSVRFYTARIDGDIINLSHVWIPIE